MGTSCILDKWMVEFGVRSRRHDRLVVKMLSLVPQLRDDVGLKKMVLFRAIDSEVDEGSVSEKTLDVLEIAFELDRKQGLDVLESMKAAYCAVAVDCVARFVKSVGEGDKYFKAVKRVWRKRIGRLFSLNVGLVSEQLDTWRNTVESAIWDDNVRDKLFVTNTRYEALIATKGYLDEAWKTVGPSFLELLVSSTLGKSFVEAQSLCLPRTSEPIEGGSQRPFDTPDPDIRTEKCDGEVLKGPCDPSSPISSPMLKNKDRDDVPNILTQNLGFNSKNPNVEHREEVSEASLCAHTVNLHPDETVKLAVFGTAEEQNLPPTSRGLTLDQSENVEPVHLKAKGAEEADLPLPGVSANNSFDNDDHLKGADTNVVKEKEADMPSSCPHGNLPSQSNSKVLYKEDTNKLRGRSKHAGRFKKRFKRVRINDTDDVDLEESDNQYDLLPENTVAKIHEELKSSSIELHAVVKDPLPGALHVAEVVISDVSRNCIPREIPVASITNMDTLNSCDVEEEKGKDKISTSHAIKASASSMEGSAMNLKSNQGHERDPRDAAINASTPEAVGDGDKNLQNEGSGHENRQKRVNLWERNCSAHTYKVRYPFSVMFLSNK
uniref:Uncharacterized protein n=1 Tax=Kalanchoe fedtschenkoi TaxID=63787 RepID=A0A7N0TY42_KALFE